ncbi:MAG TPA: diguanylate cyclase [Ruminococcus sp.]|nr:diguanylate cyclase [Ruminococcus sp.]
MANRSRTTGYKLAAFFLFLTIAISALLINLIYIAGDNVNKNSIGSVQHVNTINNKFSEIDENVLMVVAGVDETSGIDSVNNIKNAFASIRTHMNEYEQIENHSELELHRYTQAKIAINAYEKKLNEVFGDISDTENKNAGDIFMQEIYPTATVAREMLDAVTELGSKHAENMLQKNFRYYIIANGILGLALILGEIGIALAARRVKKANKEIDAQNTRLAAAGQRIEQSNQKMQDLTVTNLITGMKNRYALVDDLEERMETDQFNVAVLDMDGFKSFNDSYGYNFGDEYISAVAAKLSADFGDVADIYNISGNEFCFIFHSDVPDTHAQRIADKIRASMSAPFNILGLTVQTTASGSVYHYLPSDGLNVDTLLVKMDNAMRQVKLNGGNAVATVNSI